jgi:hypothetical protein
MKPIQESYPFFEANQVLTSSHLNQLFDYLDEQERLTRANLIGIGIECGLEIRSETIGSDKVIHLHKGCGVGSAGYQMVEPDDVTLVSYKKYTLPVEVDYPQLKYESGGKMVQYPLWELFPAGEPNAVSLTKEPTFTDNKAVILFLELKKEGLRNCSANNCDDKGGLVTATVRRLLIGFDDLAKIIAVSNQLGTEYTATDIETALLSRINLPDIRLPRYNVPNSAPVTTNEVYAAFLTVFQKNRVASAMGKALSAAYKAFTPLVHEIYPTDPFTGFVKKFGFLDGIPADTGQVRFLQYYLDFFDDLIQAYEEYRWKGASLMCACSPPEALFPRHLMLGLINPGLVKNPGIYRHDFLSSPAIKGCEERKAELLQLFTRLVEMVTHFTNNPTPPDFTNKEVARKFIPVRITPTKLSDAPLSSKAIPYYYLQTGNPPLFHVWNVEKTRRNRANQNLSYRSDEYIPHAPAFVTRPLDYDLEPFNFFRIEGHLGKNVKSVMSTLLEIKTTNRLPIEIVALRTGEFDARIPVDLSREQCRFDDLEALFDALRDEFISALGKTLASFYKRKVSREILLTDAPKATLIHTYNRDAVVEPSTFGAMLEMHYSTQRKSKSEITTSSKRASRFNIKDAFIGESAIIQATASYAEILLDICNYLKNRLLSDFSLTEFSDMFEQLEFLNGQFRKQADAASNEWNDLFNLLEAVRYASQMEAFRSIGETYAKRLTDVKKKLFLSNFLQKNPGIQHKAGVPTGGTFIVVYHDDPTPVRLQTGALPNYSSLKAGFREVGFASESSDTISKAFERLMIKGDASQIDPDIKLIINEMSKQIDRTDLGTEKGIREKTAEKIIAKTVNELADGTVIADFYLPYICCSDCSPIQFILPKAPLNFSVNMECTNSDDKANIRITPTGGMPPYKIKINSAEFIDLKNEFLLASGNYTLILRDIEGTLSGSQQIEVPAHLSLGTPEYECVGDQGEYVASLQISGGTPPYTSKSGKIEGVNFMSDPIPSKTNAELVVTDSRGCSAAVMASHTCDKPCLLPCEGKSRKSAYRLWLQPPYEGTPYKSYNQLKEVVFRFAGKTIHLPSSADLLQMPVDLLNNDFKGAMAKMVGNLNKVIQKSMIELMGDAGKNRLMITYEPADTDPFGIIWIEHFVCETFNLEFEYKVAKPSQGFTLSVSYTNEPDANGNAFSGAIMTNLELKEKMIVPAFDGRERNQCAGTDYVKLCTDTLLKPEVAIDQQDNNLFTFQSVSNEKNLISWVWDILNADANEPFYVGKRAQAIVPKPEGAVRLVMINSNGCFTIAENKFK